MMNINERTYFMKIYGDQMSALDDAFDSLAQIKNIKDKILRKKIIQMKISIKAMIGELRKY